MIQRSAIRLKIQSFLSKQTELPKLSQLTFFQIILDLVLVRDSWLPVFSAYQTTLFQAVVELPSNLLF